jgi:hypothetical protein
LGALELPLDAAPATETPAALRRAAVTLAAMNCVVFMASLSSLIVRRS